MIDPTSDSLLHGHLSVDFGEFDVIDIDDASASSQSVSSSPRRHRVAESDLLHPVDSGGVLVRSGLAPSDQSPVVVDEDSEVLMPTDLEQQQFPVLDLVGPSAPDVVLRLHDHFQPVVQPFGGHVVWIEEDKAFRRIDEADFEGDSQPKVALGQVARAGQSVGLEVGVLRSLGLEVAAFVVAESDEVGIAI